MSFDKYAAEWDTEKRINRAQEIAEEIRKSLSETRYAQGLEFGCGTGLVSYNLIDIMDHVTMLDISKEMIEIVKEKANRNNLKNVHAQHADVMQTEFDTKYDAIYSSMVFHHIDDVEAVFKKLYDMMNAGGEICIVDIDEEDGSFHSNYPEFDGHNGFNHSELKTIMEKVGFQNVDIQTFYHDVKVIENRKIDYSLFRVVGRK